MLLGFGWYDIGIMEPTQTNNPQQPEPKKSFWAKLFGGGKKDTTQPVMPPTLPTQPEPSSTPPFSPPTLSQQDAPSISESAGQQISPSTPTSPPVSEPISQPVAEVTPEDANAVDAALNALPEIPPQEPIAAPAPPQESTIPPTPPSDPMVTPTPSNPAPTPPLPTPPHPPVAEEAPSTDPTQEQDDSNNRPPLTPPIR